MPTKTEWHAVCIGKQQANRREESMNGKLAFGISIAVLLTALGFLLFTGLNANMVYYFQVDEYIHKAPSLAGETVKVNGTVADGTIKKTGLEYAFIVQGQNGQNQLNVNYRGVVPDTFREGSDVVIEGRYDPQAKVFHCTTLLAKCPSKYEKQQRAAAEGR
jgi:cytochrome c-type biogenesis protein CcmE